MEQCITDDMHFVPDNINNDKFESAILKPDEEYNMNIKLKFL